MEQLDLTAAKEEATRENWNIRLPHYNKEVEDEFPHQASDPSPGYDPLNPDADHLHDEWRTAMHLRTGSSASDCPCEDDTYVESEGLDDDEYQDLTEYKSFEAGVTEDAIQSGSVHDSVRGTLSSLVRDLTEIDDRKVQIDLTFLQNANNIERVRRVIEGVIKKYTTIPGQVEVKKVAQSGVFTFNVTNTYLSLTSDSSDSPVVPRRVKARPLVTPSEPHQTPIFSELIKGITLIPKFAGLPPKVLRYGELGLTPEGLRKLRANNPSQPRNDLIISALKLSGNYRKALNLYRLP